MALPASPVPRDVQVELRRVVERWHQLPLDRASSRVGPVRALAQRLADAVPPPPPEVVAARRSTIRRPSAATSGGALLPELGPGVLMDQLRVTVYDACAAGLAAGVADELARLRRQLA